MSTFKTTTSLVRLGALVSVLLPVAITAIVYLSLPHTAYAVITSASQLSDTCVKSPNGSLCNAEENAFLNGQQAVQNSDANNQGQAAQLINQGVRASTTRNTPQPAPKPTSCASTLNYLGNPFTCMFRSLMSLTAATLIWISSLLLSIAGLLFNWLMDNTVIQFGTFYGTIKVAVETAWTAFRDIANILIIGIFTFVAISIIVGLKEFGQKKMIAHVLIVAVLINFSLLFTKMIIDASNYTAAQIYTAAALGGSNTVGSGGAVGATGTATKYGVADQFMNLLGIATYADALKTVKDIGEAQDSGWATFGHGLLTTVVVLAAAMVLFYGCFLLISRMIMLIFLLVTASIAVGSSLVPGWGGSSFGWDAWKKSLLWCVTLAPMLMILLWMTLSVSGAIVGPPKAGKATLGGALSDPTSGSNISALFNYVLILGLLFTTFKVSSMWAGKIGGFNVASMATALPLTLGSRLAGFGLRQTLGRGNAFRALGLGDDIDTQKKKAREAKGTPAEYKEYKKLETLMRTKQRAETRAGSSFNLLNTGPAKALMAGVGVTGFAAGADKKPPSFADSSSARAAKAAKEASGLALSQDEKNTIRGQAIENKVKDKEARREKLKLDKEAHAQELDLKKKAIETEEQTLQSHHDREVKVQETMKKKDTDVLNGIAKEIAKATAANDPTRREAYEEDYARTEAAQKSSMQEQDSKINDIKTQLHTLTAPVKAVEEELAKVNKELEGDLKDNATMFKSAEREVKDEKIVEKAEDNAREVAMKVGASLAYSGPISAVQKMLGIDPSKSTVAGKKAFKEIKKKIKQKKASDMLTAMTEASGEAAEPAAGGDTGSDAAAKH